MQKLIPIWPPEFHALLDTASRPGGNPGIHKKCDPGPQDVFAPTPRLIPTGNITYRCGHTLPVHSSKPITAEYRAMAATDRDCLNCLETAQAEAISSKAIEAGLPAFRGSIRQQLYAESIRRDRLDQISVARSSGALTRRKENAIDRRLAIDDAAWWIDCRNVALEVFIKTTLSRRRT
ncbi:MAG: hypothetical protein ACRYFS_25230 [Janthinobacterium lividum]